MSDEDEDESEKVKKETVGFAWSSQACQIRIVVCLFILSVLLGALTAYIIIPRLKEDCKRYHSRKEALTKVQARQGLSTPAGNYTDEVNSSSYSAVSSERHAPTRNSASFSSTTSGPAATLPGSAYTQKLADDIARGMSGRSTIDSHSDSKDDNDEIVVIVETERKIGTALVPTLGGANLPYWTDTVGGKLSITNGITSRELSTPASSVNAGRTTAVGSVSEAYDTIGPAMSSATTKRTMNSSAASGITISELSSSSLSIPVVISYDASHTHENLSGNLPESGIATPEYVPSKGGALARTKNGIVMTSGDAVTGARQRATHATSEGSFDDTGTDAVRNGSIETATSFHTTSTSLSGVLPSGASSFRDIVVPAITKEYDTLNGAGAYLVTASGAPGNEPQHWRRTTQEGGRGDAAAGEPERPRFESTLHATTPLGTLSDYYPADADVDSPENTKERDLTNGKRVSGDTQDDPLERASRTVADEDQKLYIQEHRPPNSAAAEGALREQAAVHKVT